jgi:hypothetical protein
MLHSLKCPINWRTLAGQDSKLIQLAKYLLCHEIHEPVLIARYVVNVDLVKTTGRAFIDQIEKLISARNQGDKLVHFFGRHIA